MKKTIIWIVGMVLLASLVFGTRLCWEGGEYYAWLPMPREDHSQAYKGCCIDMNIQAREGYFKCLNPYQCLESGSSTYEYQCGYGGDIPKYADNPEKTRNIGEPISGIAMYEEYCSYFSPPESPNVDTACDLDEMTIIYEARDPCPDTGCDFLKEIPSEDGTGTIPNPNYCNCVAVDTCGNGQFDAGLEECETDEQCSEGFFCSSECKCVQPVCGNGKIEGDEQCDPPDSESDSCNGMECLSNCTCKPISAEECNGEDDDGDGLIDEDDNCRSLTEGELNYCLMPDECPIDSVCGYQTDDAVVGQAGGGECKICGSVCKTCPPHPPEATKGNPLGICAPEPKGYPYSKNCLDWKNKVSCGTCIDTDNDGNRETFVARKDDGTWGVDINNQPIFRGGDKVISNIKEVIFPSFPKFGPEHNKDYKQGDNLIDCRLAVPSLFSGVLGSDAISDANALYGICDGNMCISRKASSCMSDCYWGYETRRTDPDKSKWFSFDKNNRKQKPIGPAIELLNLCPPKTQDRNSYYAGYVSIKNKGSWGELLSTPDESDCFVTRSGKGYLKCGTMNRKLMENPIKTKELREWCIDFVNDEKKAYWYSVLGGEIKTRVSNCFCIEAKRDLEPWPEMAIAFDFKSPTELACAYPETPSSCFLSIVDIFLQDTIPEDSVAIALESIREWTVS